MSYIPLHVHSQYSILDSAASIQGLVKKAESFSLPALALTDFCNMFGAIEFYKACKVEGINPIIGCEVMVAPESRLDKKKTGGHIYGFPLLLLVKNKKGYQNLCKIVSLGYLEGFYYTPRIDKEILATYSEGLICLSGPLKGKISQLIIQDKEEELLAEISWAESVYKNDFYLEVQRHDMNEKSISEEGIDHESWLYQSYLETIKNQTKVISRLKVLGAEKGIPLVATNEIHYLERVDWKAHEILMNIQSGEPCELIEKDSYGNPRGRVLNPKRKVVPTHELYFKSPVEMQALFHDLPEAIASTVAIAEKCNFEMDLKSRFYPVFIPPALENKEFEEKTRIIEAENFLRDLCRLGIEKRYREEQLEKVKEKYPNEEPLEVVKKRLAYELDIITSKGMCDYLLIVYDFIAWAKGQDIPVGPGRGSGAGSIILYLIGITDIEPLRFNLFFERFINPERMSYPDIDVDICMERRVEVIEYTLKKYGQDKVAQIITFGTMKAKMAIKDVGRVLSVPLAKVNDIAKLVPEDPTMTLDRALEIDIELRKIFDTDEDAKRIIEYAKKLEGSIRNTGIHAAGLIICGDPLMDHIPICTAKDSLIPVTQFSMKPVESAGMLKIDFLGLKTLTSIQKAVIAIEENTGIKIDWVNLPLEDQETFNLLNQGKTHGIFQLESSGMQELAKHLHIDKFEEIIAVGALYRPGPMEMIPSFINRKHGREEIEVDHPLMEDIIRETYGIMVYQEQVMQIASLLANYTLGEGDVLRRAMGKKDKEEMANQREKFRLGALKNGISEDKSMIIFDKIEKFASYGFNKSHAAAYGYLSYVTAYLKAHYPKEWLASLMTCDIDDLSKVAKHIRECESMEIQILSPDVNESGSEFVATPGGIRFAMSGIKGVGEGVVDTIIKERKQAGPFTSQYDFFKRVDSSRVGKKIVENLIGAGSFDFTGWSRQALIQSVEPMFERAAREHKEKAKGILDFFSVMEEAQGIFTTPPQIDHPLPKKEILSKEKELLGFYLSGHPMDDYRDLIKKLECRTFQEIIGSDRGGCFPTAFIIESIKVKVSAKTQRKFAFLTISDGLECAELPIWPDIYEEKSHLFVENQLIYGVLQTEKEDTIKFRCRALEDLTKIDDSMIQKLTTTYLQLQETIQMEEKKRKSSGGSLFHPKETKDQKELHLSIDVERIRLSHLVQLKKIINQFPGDTPVVSSFFSEGKCLGTLSIESTHGIQWNNTIEKELQLLSAISYAIKEC